VTQRRGKRGAAVLLLFFASGAAGLVYQVVWLRQLTLIFGATAFASSAVLSTFMGGLALGSYWAGRRADGWRDPPLRTYGMLELGITLYAAAIPWLLAHSTPVLEFAWKLGAERHFVLFGFVKFVAIGIVILPATTLMGATLPVLARVASRSGRSVGAGVGTLYAANTFGAVAGTVVAAFVALPALGMKRTLLANLALNAVVGVVAWSAARGATPVELDVVPVQPARNAMEGPVWPLLLVFGASGFAAMVLEVAWTRSLALVLGSSVYAYASMLTAFLLGLASGAGAAAVFLVRKRKTDSRVALSVVLAAAGMLSFAAAHAIQTLPRLFAEVYFRLHPSPEGWWLAQLGIALFVMFPTTFALGWVFPLGLEVLGGDRTRVASSVGRVYAANTVGTILGAACGGFLLIPLAGVGTTLVGVAVGQLLLGAVLFLGSGAGSPRARRSRAAFCLGAAFACVAARPAWDVMMMNSGVYMNISDLNTSPNWAEFRRLVRTNNELVYARDGLTSSIVVAWQPASDNLYLAVNGKTDASSRQDLQTQVLLGQLPLLLHPAPRDVAIVGLASGITAASAATHSVDRIRVIEVEGAMVEAAERFARFNRGVLDDPRLTLSINDARNELQFNPALYDVIISEPSNPWMTVASNLFTEDFFRIGRTRLRPGGIFGQWIQTYCLTPRSLSSILAGFHRVFPHVLVFAMASGVDLVVVGSDHPLALDLDETNRRMSDLWVRADLARASVSSELDMAAMLQTGGNALTDLLRAAVPNTDENGLVEFSAPKAFYLDTEDQNTALLRGNADDPLTTLEGLISPPQPPDRFRMDMIRRWSLWDQRERAARAAALLGDLHLKEEADILVRSGR